MRTLVTLNIGLNTVNNTRVDVHRALGAIAACGVSITTSAVVNGEWEGKPESCLFVQGFVADPLGVAFRAQLYLASRLLSQHVIALYSDGRGELIGDNPGGWKFEEDKFHFHPEKRVRLDTPLSECQTLYVEIIGEDSLSGAITGTHEQIEFATRLLNILQSDGGMYAPSVTFNVETPPLSECQAIQKETAERILRNEYAAVNSVHAGAAIERVASQLGVTL